VGRPIDHLPRLRMEQMHLPQTHQNAQSDRMVSAEAVATSRPAHTILVVDDDPSFRGALVELIGIDPRLKVVGSACDASEGAEMVRSLRPSVCLCDVGLPGGGGEVVAAEARRSAPETRVVALSACDDTGTIMGMIRAGAISYIVKGAAGDEVLDGIHRAIRGQASMPARAATAVGAELRGQEEDSQGKVILLRNVLDHDLMNVVFQPVVDIETREPIAFEALCRVNAPPQRPPDMWFADAADNDLGLEFELQAIRLALGHLSHLPGGCPLHINASPAVATSKELASLLEGIGPERIILEITEHTQIEDYPALTAALAPLRAAGVLIGVDDAGSGFSSMSHIVNMEADVIKVDISLVRDIHLNKMRRAMVGALAEFARQAEALVIAEGVELEEERATLITLGVTAAQGYLFGRPAPCSCATPHVEKPAAVAVSA
jgi:EAL domain-containing protein (putative c-di-GMP-specific phosphodiesterase class I)/ActR/RegA family two-component response regulator